MTTIDGSSNPFFLIRSTIEAEIPAPGVLTISSALSADGKTSVAAGIARSLAAAGYATLAVDAAADSAQATSVEVATARLADSARSLDAGCDYVALAPAEARAASAMTIAAFFAAIRARYDYAIVDTNVVSSGGLAFARTADGVVLAVREGRAVTDADRDAVELFERLRVRFLGVIATRDDGEHHGTGPRTLMERLAAPAPRRVAPIVEKPLRGVAFGRLLRRLRSSV
jgi:Mrp family chromosome partitioning ATPase